MIFQSLLYSLLLTLLIEVPITCRCKVPLKVAVAANIITNPMVVLLFHWAKYLALPLVWVVLLLEISAVAVEGYLYREYLPRPWRFSLLVNGISFAVGLCLLR